MYTYILSSSSEILDNICPIHMWKLKGKQNKHKKDLGVVEPGAGAHLPLSFSLKVSQTSRLERCLKISDGFTERVRKLNHHTSILDE